MERNESGSGSRTYTVNVQKHAMAKNKNSFFNLDFFLHYYSIIFIFFTSFLSFIRYNFISITICIFFKLEFFWGEIKIRIFFLDPDPDLDPYGEFPDPRSGSA